MEVLVNIVLTIIMVGTLVCILNALEYLKRWEEYDNGKLDYVSAAGATDDHYGDGAGADSSGSELP